MKLIQFPKTISKNDLEQSIFCVLLLTATTAKPDDIHLCHRLKNTEKAIAKFKDRKQRNDVIFKRKGLKSKAAGLRPL